MTLKTLMGKIETANEIASLSGSDFFYVRIEVDTLTQRRFIVGDEKFFTWREILQSIRQDWNKAIVNIFKTGELKHNGRGQLEIENDLGILITIECLEF